MSEKTLVEQLRSAEMKGQFGLGFGQIASCIETRYTPNSEITAKYMPYPLDADGVPCKVGDLMETDEHIPRKVVGYYLDCPEYPCVTLEFVSPSVESYKLHHVKQPKQLTKEDIDALAKMEYSKYWGCKGTACLECPAKIDGETPWERYREVDDPRIAACDQAQTLDILRLERERVAGEQAEKAWNTRAESTCRVVSHSVFCGSCGAKVVDDETL